MVSYLKMQDLGSSFSHEKYQLCGLPLRKKYRSHFEIIALVLEAARDGGATRFPIMQHASINCKQLKKCLQTLTEIGFIERYRTENRCVYRTSEKGQDFLAQYHVLLSMLLGIPESTKLSNTAYRAEYDMPTMSQEATTRLVTPLQRNP